jgi:DNA polymerase-3 subunit epsilon
MILFFDTETTGLPKSRYEDAHKRPDNWPHIVSISWIVLDSDTNRVLTQATYIVCPDGKWTIPLESTRIHGIDHEFAEDYGAPLDAVMEEFLAVEHDMVVSHNMDFDENVVVQAVKWDMKREEFNGFMKPKHCTMMLGRSMCKLSFANGGSGYKLPKLSELYEHVFRAKPDASRLHGSMYDTELVVDIIKHHDPMRLMLGLRRAGVDTANANSSRNNIFE